jgi:UbiA prenyltransferase family protein
MGSLTASRLIAFRTVLGLGRVSNLPTVWSNVIAARALAGSGPNGVLLMAAAAMSLLYVGGMYLNDAFDREIDARERPSRPIPAGAVSVATVFASGFSMLAIGVILLLVLGFAAGVAGLVLALAIVLYDWHHKGNPLSPLIMGVCRALVYVGATAALGAAFEPRVVIGAFVMLLFVTGLTLAAKEESLNRIPDKGPLLLFAAPLTAAIPAFASSWLVPFAFSFLLGLLGYALWLFRRREPDDVRLGVSLLIAAIALVDALAAASAGALPAMLACFGLFLLTLLLQRFIAGT